MNAKFSQQVENKQIIYTLKQRPQTAKVPRCRVQSTAVHLSPQERLKSRLREGARSILWSLQSARTSPLYRQSPPCFVRHIP